MTDQNTMAKSVNKHEFTKLYASTFVGRHQDVIGSLLDDGRICFFTGELIPQAGKVYEVEVVGLAGQGKQYAVVKAIKEDYPPLKREFTANAMPAPNPYAPKATTPCAYMPQAPPKTNHLPNFYATIRTSGGTHVAIPKALWGHYKPYYLQRVMLRLQPVDAPNRELPTCNVRVSTAGAGYGFHIPRSIAHAYNDYAGKKVLVTATPGA